MEIRRRDVRGRRPPGGLSSWKDRSSSANTGEQKKKQQPWSRTPPPPPGPEGPGSTRLATSDPPTWSSSTSSLENQAHQRPQNLYRSTRTSATVGVHSPGVRARARAVKTRTVGKNTQTRIINVRVATLNPEGRVQTAYGLCYHGNQTRSTNVLISLDDSPRVEQKMMMNR